MNDNFSTTIDFSRIVPHLKSQKILITGGTGFFGKSICRVLTYLNKQYDAGCIVTTLGRSHVAQEGITFIKHDINDPLNFSADFDYIIHAANPTDDGRKDFDQTIRTIVKGTENILEFAKNNNCSKLLLISSGAIYGEQPESVKKLTEDYINNAPIYNLNSAYMTGKRLSEAKALEFTQHNNLSINIARCFAFSGQNLPLDKHFAIGNFIKDALSGKPILVKGDGTALRSYLDSEDLVLWLLTILFFADKNDIYNVGSDWEISIKDLAYKIAGHFENIDVVIENSNGNSSKRSKYVPSIEKAKNKLGLGVITSLDSSIEKMIRFNRENNERIS